MDSSELNSLSQSTSMPTLTISHTVSELMMFVTIASLIITVLVFIMWLMNWLHRRKVQNAILDIQATLREMNERDKARAQPIVPPQTVATLENPADSETN
ncbi:MAG TPA: hypothetical protein VFQ70_02410 [Candidatus Saccharimonadaceae bacterium]|nr:hypothetical protein [Candidatus Saccharimonadaceae bacterium]